MSIEWYTVTGSPLPLAQAQHTNVSVDGVSSILDTGTSVCAHGDVFCTLFIFAQAALRIHLREPPGHRIERTRSEQSKASKAALRTCLYAEIQAETNFACRWSRVSMQKFRALLGAQCASHTVNLFFLQSTPGRSFCTQGTMRRQWERRDTGSANLGWCGAHWTSDTKRRITGCTVR